MTNAMIEGLAYLLRFCWVHRDHGLENYELQDILARSGLAEWSMEAAPDGDALATAFLVLSPKGQNAIHIGEVEE